ncbi:acyl-CoA dehydrogenase family protein [Streptomyces rapamycinicus]
MAQALRPHFGFVEKLISDSGKEDRERWFAAALAGELFGNATGEATAKHPGDIHTALVPDGDRYRLSGTKYHSTGSLFADWVVIAAKDHLDRRVRVVLPRGRPGLRLIDDWDGMGQRMTASGTTELDDVAVHPHEVVVDEAVGVRRTHLGAYHQLFLAAVETGIAKNAVRDAVGYARDRVRAVRHSGVDHAVQDPFVQHTVGEMAALGYGAEATVERAAAAIDRALAGPTARTVWRAVNRRSPRRPPRWRRRRWWPPRPCGRRSGCTTWAGPRPPGASSTSTATGATRAPWSATIRSPTRHVWWATTSSTPNPRR